MANNIKILVDKAIELGCEVRLNEKLSLHTTFKIGGSCKAFVIIKSKESISELIKLSNDLNEKFMVIGNGSNLLFDDKGFNGVIFQIGSSMQNIELFDSNTIKVEAGVSLIKLCLFAAENCLSGLEFAYGIPGTIGGAVYMNAGAYGGEIKDVIVSCTAVNNRGEVIELNKDSMGLSYRHSCFQNSDLIIISATFLLKNGKKKDIQEKMSDLMFKRKDKQPLEFPNAGSTFKRPEGQFAGKLIQDCGLKGFSVGGAQVSEKHSGFVINKGNATFKDVTELILEVQNRVKTETGYFLECEVKIINY